MSIRIAGLLEGKLGCKDRRVIKGKAVFAQIIETASNLRIPKHCLGLS